MRSHVFGSRKVTTTKLETESIGCKVSEELAGLVFKKATSSWPNND
jgi:hypothetical protein